MIYRLRLISLLLACAFICLGYGLALGWQWVFLGIGLGLAGWLVLWKLPRPPGTLIFYIGIALAVVGVIQGATLWAMLPVVAFSLAFWDLDALAGRAEEHFRHQVQGNAGSQRLEKRHLRRLFPAISLGLLLGLAGMALQLKLSLGWAIVLALVIIFSLRLGLSGWMKESG